MVDDENMFNNVWDLYKTRCFTRFFYMFYQTKCMIFGDREYTAMLKSHCTDIKYLMYHLNYFNAKYKMSTMDYFYVNYYTMY